MRGYRHQNGGDKVGFGLFFPAATSVAILPVVTAVTPSKGVFDIRGEEYEV